MMTDPIADFLTRMRNAQMVRRPHTTAKASKMTVCIAENLKRKGFIKDFSVEKDGVFSTIKVQLKYDSLGEPVIEALKRVSRPGLRVYCKAEEMPKIRDGLGLAIVSTSRGVMTSQEAIEKRVGGEVLCYVW